MPEYVLDQKALEFVRHFEEATGAHARDCVAAEDKVVFLVPAEEIPRAVGPGGQRIERLKGLWKREIVVVEDSSDPAQLALHLFYPYHPKRVEFSSREGGRHVTVYVDPAWKARAIGKGGRHLKIARAVLLRHSDVVSVSVAGEESPPS